MTVHLRESNHVCSALAYSSFISEAMTMTAGKAVSLSNPRWVSCKWNDLYFRSFKKSSRGCLTRVSNSLSASGPGILKCLYTFLGSVESSAMMQVSLGRKDKKGFAEVRSPSNLLSHFDEQIVGRKWMIRRFRQFWQKHIPQQLLVFVVMSRSEWDSQSNLLLVQLIYKYGDPFDPSSSSSSSVATSPVFEQIAQQLTTHSLIRPSKRKFTGTVRYITLTLYCSWRDRFANNIMWTSSLRNPSLESASFIIVD